jgi:hypothetical protein
MKKTEKAKVSKSNELKHRIGLMKRTKANREAVGALSEADSLNLFFNALYTYLNTPENKVFRAAKFDEESGDAIDGKFIVDKDSVPLYFYFDEGFKELFPYGTKVLAYLVKMLPKKGCHLMQVTNGSMLFEYRQRMIGGGHNETPSYAIQIAATVVRSHSEFIRVTSKK